PATGAARECQPARRPARNLLSLVARAATPARSGRGGSAWLVYVAGVDVVDGRHDRGECAADLFGRLPPSVLCLPLRRGGGEPPGGIEAPAVAFGRLDGPVNRGRHQADEQDNKDGDQHSHGHHPFQRPGQGDGPSKAGSHRIFQTVRMRLTRASAAWRLLRFSLRRPSAPACKGKWATRLNGPGGPNTTP